jgi:hypothetical protein
MGTGYTRNDTSNNIADGNVINAADLDGEFDAIESAFNSSTGHTHDGTSAEGAPIEVLGPSQDVVITASALRPKTTNTVDLGTSSLLYKDAFIDGTATIGGIVIDNDGTIGSASDTDAITIGSGGVVTFSQAPTVDIESATTNSTINTLVLKAQSSGTPAVGIGTGMRFDVETAAGNVEQGAAIRAITTSLTPTDEEIDLVFYSMQNGSLVEAFRYDSTNDLLDVSGSIKIVGGQTLQSDGVINISADSDASGSGGINFKTNNVLRIVIHNNGDASFYEDTGATVKMDWDATNEYLHFRDDVKAVFGTSADLQIYHDASNSYISESGTGELKLTTNGTGITFEKADGTEIFDVTTTAATKLYYNGNEKLATTSGGVDITGSTVNITGTQAATTLTIESTDAGSADGPVFKLYRNSTSPLADDDIGRIDFNGENSSVAELTYARIDSFIEDPTASAEKGRMRLLVEASGIQRSFLEVDGSTGGADGRTIVNAGLNDIDFQVAGDTVTNLLYVDASTDRIGINTNTPSADLHIIATDSGGSNPHLQIETTDAGASAGPELHLYRNSASPAAQDGLGIIRYYGEDDGGNQQQYAYLYGQIVDPTGASESGKLTTAVSINGAMRSVIMAGPTEVVINDGSEDVNFRVESGSDANLFFADAGVSRVGIGTNSPSEKLHITGGSASVTLLLESTSDNASDGPILDIYRNSASAAANDNIGIIYFSGDDDAGNKHAYARIDTFIENATNGSEDARVTVGLMSGGSNKQFMGLRSDAGGADGEIVFNESQNDINLRIESNTASNLFFADAGTDRIGIGTTPSYKLHISDDGGGAAVSMMLQNSGTTAADSTILRMSTGGTTSNNYIYFGDSADSNAGQIRYNHSSDFMTFQTSGAEVARINSSGFLGVSTTDPKGLVHVDNTSGNAPSFLSSGANDAELDFACDHDEVMQFGGYNKTTAAVDAVRMSLEANGNVTIENGDLVVASGHGINFSATGDGSGTVDSETLDNYEQGQWTPVLTDTSTTATSSGTTPNGRYIRVGNLITVFGRFSNPDLSNLTSSEDLRVTGLPYTSSSFGGGSINFMGSNRLENVDYDTGAGTFIVPNIVENASYIRFQEVRRDTSDDYLTVSQFDSTSDAWFQVTYTISTF